MADGNFIGRPNLPEGLAALIVQLQSKSPLGETLEAASSQIGKGIGTLAEFQQAQQKAILQKQLAQQQMITDIVREGMQQGTLGQLGTERTGAGGWETTTKPTPLPSGATAPAGYRVPKETPEKPKAGEIRLSDLFRSMGITDEQMLSQAQNMVVKDKPQKPGTLKSVVKLSDEESPLFEGEKEVPVDVYKAKMGLQPKAQQMVPVTAELKTIYKETLGRDLMATEISKDLQDYIFDQSKVKTSAAEKAKAAKTVTGLSPEGLKFATQYLLKTGTMLPTGLAAGARVQTINAAGEQQELKEKAGEKTEDPASSAAKYKATSVALANITKQKSVIGAFESLAEKSLTFAVEQSKIVGRTGIPIFNQWITAGKKATGDPEISKFDVHIRTAINEYAKVATTVTGGGVTSDTARQEVEGLLFAAQTPKQFEAAAGALSREMKARMTAYDEEISLLETELKQSPWMTQKPKEQTRAEGKITAEGVRQWIQTRKKIKK